MSTVTITSASAGARAGQSLRRTVGRPQRPSRAGGSTSSRRARNTRPRAGDKSPLDQAKGIFDGFFKEKEDPLPVGSTVSPFSLPSSNGGTTAVPASGSKFACVFFYPKSDTPGCKAEGDSFNAQASAFADKGCQLVGVSIEPVEALCSSNAGRDIELLSDADGSVSAAFDAEMNLVVAKFSARKTFLLSPTGEILAKWSEGKDMGDIKDGGHAKEVLAAIDSLA